MLARSFYRGQVACSRSCLHLEVWRNGDPQKKLQRFHWHHQLVAAGLAVVQLAVAMIDLDSAIAADCSVGSGQNFGYHLRQS